MTNIKDLLKQYADTCEVVGRDRLCGTLTEIEGQSIRSRKANLESQIIKLFEEARSEGAQVERELIPLLKEAETLLVKHHDSRLTTFGGKCPVCPDGIFRRIAEAIRESKQADEAEGNETK